MSKRFTQEERELVVSEIKASKTNLRDAFRKAAKMLGRSTATISDLYYRHLRFDKHFFTLDQGKRNVKNWVSKDKENRIVTVQSKIKRVRRYPLTERNQNLMSRYRTELRLLKSKL